MRFFLRGKDRRKEFEQQVDKYASRLHWAAKRLALNDADAEDLTQDTLLRAYKAFDSFESGTNFLSWALRIMTNSYISNYRRKRKIPFVPWEDAVIEDERPVASGVLANTSTPEALLIERCFDEDIETAMDSLSEATRMVILLVDVEGLSYEQAAEAMNIPIGTVRSRLNRGRESLRQAIVASQQLTQESRKGASGRNDG